MRTSAKARRRATRGRTTTGRILRLCLDDNRGGERWITADMLDASAGGVGVALTAPLAVGAEIQVNGLPGRQENTEPVACAARVCWCLEKTDGSFRAGLEFADCEFGAEEGNEHTLPPSEESPTEEDHYEVLQLSANAHPDTIHRVYRILAQRYHPDNRETGDGDAFRRVAAAYKVLKDGTRRAAYDARRQSVRRSQWRLFNTSAESVGIEAEKCKREGILALLYAHRIQDPDGPAIGIHVLEDLLGCPRDHLQVSLWYLKEKGHIKRDDRGRYSITVEGVDEAESRPNSQPGLRYLPKARGAAV